MSIRVEGKSFQSRGKQELKMRKTEIPANAEFPGRSLFLRPPLTCSATPQLRELACQEPLAAHGGTVCGLVASSGSAEVNRKEKTGEGRRYCLVGWLAGWLGWLADMLSGQGCVPQVALTHGAQGEWERLFSWGRFIQENKALDLWANSGKATPATISLNCVLYNTQASETMRPSSQLLMCH